MESNSNNSKQSTKKEKKIDWQFIAKEACKFLRIGGTWYKKCVHPVTNEVVLEHYRAEDVIRDYGKDNGPLILDSAAKLISIIPSPTSYKQVVNGRISSVS